MGSAVRPRSTLGDRRRGCGVVRRLAAERHHERHERHAHHIIQGNAFNLNAAGSGQYPDQVADPAILGGIGVGNEYFNRANVANPGGDISNAGTFGFVTSTTGVGERNIRFGARVAF